MKCKFQIYLFFFALLLFSCLESEKDYTVFTEKKPQDAAERTVRQLTPVDSLNLTKAFDGQSLTDIKLNDSALFAEVGDQIVRLSKQDLGTELVFTIPEGRGPGEIVNFNVAKIEVGKKRIAVYDKNAKKTMLYDLNGNFREEFLNEGYQVSSMAIADEDTYYFEIMPNLNYLFFEVERKESESVVRRRFQPRADDINILAYGGEIVYHNRSLYFGGRPEPLIRRYDLSGEEPDLVFSRAVIDDYNSENNYEKPERSSDFHIWAYTDEVKYASQDIAVDDNYLYSVRHHNDEEGYKYLDIYDVEDGSYRRSFSLLHYPSEIAVDEDYIYTLESEGNDPIRKYLIKYEKPDMN